MGQQDGDGGKVTASKATTNFCDYTSAHGYGRIVAQTLIVGRVIWVICLLGSYAGFSYHLYTLIDRFMDTPLLTSLDTTLPYKFPEIYICPTNALSMSKLSTRFNATIDKPKIRGSMKDCNTTCQAKLTKFDIRVNPELSLPTYAVVDATTTAELTITDYFQNKQYATFSECRFTIKGEEYNGTKNTVPVYFNSTLVEFTNSTTVPKAAVFREVPCLPWNEAARGLKRAGIPDVSFILSQNYSESDNRCRLPGKQPLSSFFNASANAPVSISAGCFVQNETIIQFNYSCFSLPIVGLTVEICAECCYNRNFSFIAIRNATCYCSATLGRKDSKINDDECDLGCLGDTEPVLSCGGEDLTAHSMYQIQNNPLETKPIYVPYGSEFTRYFGGPYCFYNDSTFGLSASYCKLPYCSNPLEFDCYMTSQDSVVQVKQTARYSGRVNITTSERTCLVWADVKDKVENGSYKLPAILHDWDSSFTGSKVLQLIIQTPDYDLSNKTNYCRAAHVLSDILYLADTGVNAYVRETVVRSLSPGCFYLNELDGEISFETCTINKCYDSIAAVTGIIRDRVSSTLLLRQFSNDLDIGLVDCSFNNKKCTAADFQEVLHPEMGVCHRFLKAPLLKNMTNSEIADAELQVQLFTDATDSKGVSYTSTDLLEGTALSAIGGTTDNLALKVVAVPDDMFPWSSKAIDVIPAQKLALKLRYDKTTRYSKPPQACNQTVSPVTYMIDSWKSVGLNDNLTAKLDNMSYSVLNTTNWLSKINTLRDVLKNYSDTKGPLQKNMTFAIATQDDCINAYVLQKFVENCKCLPTFLPIPDSMYSLYPLCFINGSNIQALYDTSVCYNKQLDQVQNYEHAGRNNCPLPCELRFYTVSQSSYAWPNIRRETSIKFLSYLAKKYGYPSNLRMTRGPASLYSAYLTALDLSKGSLGTEMSPAELLTFDYELTILQDRLAVISVTASDFFGEEKIEDEAYPLKALFADFGGIMGLWCGASIMTFIEITELLVLLCCAAHQARTSPPAEPKPNPDDPETKGGSGSSTHDNKAFEVNANTGQPVQNGSAPTV